MYKTVIVDDDFLVRSYLKQLGAWQKAGYQITADCRDGEEALDVIERERPDVVITDISMPLMDGIELIRRVRKMSQSIYLIVLSCHDDFEYVKEAMKLGADEYVLKNSLNEESLYEMLKNVEGQLMNRLSENEKEDDTKRLIEMGRHSLKYHFFNGLLSGSFTAQEREEKQKEAGIQGRFVNSAVVNMVIPDWNALKSGSTSLEMEQYSQRFLQRLLDRLEDLLGEERRYVEAVYLGEGVFCCFLDLSEMRRDSLMKQRLTSVATACYTCSKQESYIFAIGVSGICFGADGLRQAYQQAREVVRLYFYEDGGILYYENQPSVGRELPQSAQRFTEEVQTCIKCQNIEKIEEALGEILEDFKQLHTDSRTVLHWLKETEQKAGCERSQEEYGAIVKIERLEEVFREDCKKIFQQRKRAVPEGTGPVICTVVDYLHAHFREQTGLTEAADAAGVNSAYLSYLFKQEMGIGFSNYLLDLRMECAKGMLKETNEKIKEVAARSGFNDYHYFSKAFKKQNGCSPAEYRKQVTAT